MGAINMVCLILPLPPVVFLGVGVADGVLFGLETKLAWQLLLLVLLLLLLLVVKHSASVASSSSSAGCCCCVSHGSRVSRLRGWRPLIVAAP